MTKSTTRDIMYATTIRKNIHKHVKAVSKIAKQISSELNVEYDKLSIEYNSCDSILLLNFTFTADSEDTCNEFAECLTDAISCHFYDSARMEIHETIYD